jgi:hypothetical protein|nr:MAG TPA: hypothetical protein [Caudoviricetes sp.]
MREETTEERQERLWDELQYRKTMLRVIKSMCLWIGGAALMLSVLACGADMTNEAVVTGAIALGTTLFGLL